MPFARAVARMRSALHDATRPDGPLPATGDEGAFRIRPQELRIWGAIFESMEDALVVADEGRAIILVNPAANALFGPDCFFRALDDWPAAYGLAAGEGAEPLLPREFPVFRALEGQQVDRQQMFMHGGAQASGERWLSVTAWPVTDDHGAVRAAFAVFRDITLRKRAEGALLLRERAIAASAEGITITDARKPDNPLIYVNRGFEEMTGYTADEVVGTNCRFLQGVRTSEEARQKIRDALDRDEPVTVELLNYRKGGRPFWNRLSITPIPDAQGRVTHYIGVQSDISDHVEAQRRLAEASRELEAANARMRGNLEAASRVQQALLPPDDLRIPGVPFAWRYTPCEELAGDLLGAFRLDEHRAGFFLFDVSGHGTAAALLSMSVHRALQPHLTPVSVVKRPADDGGYAITPPASVAKALSQAFPFDPATAQFTTLAYGILDARDRRFVFASAGHPPAVVVPREGEAYLAGSPGMPIGVGEDYEQAELALAPGDRVFYYSDGVTETLSPDGALYGDDRLLTLLAQDRSLTLEATLDHLLVELKAWRRGEEPRDDVSLLAFEAPEA